MSELTTDTIQNGDFLPLMEHFYTIQGEGANTGKSAYFIRLGGCDVGCHWCDVKDSWDASAHPHVSVTEMAKMAKAAGATRVVVTGGEPSMHPLDKLTSALKAEGLETYIETSGTSTLTGDFDWVCFSPKKFKKPLEQIYALAHEMKVVIFHPSDFDWALQHASKLNKDCALFVQPEWDKSENIMPLIVDFVKKNPSWRVSLQTHKWLNIP